jgi:hypothetical protein
MRACYKSVKCLRRIVVADETGMRPSPKDAPYRRSNRKHLKNGRHEETRTPDLYRVKVAL